MIRVAIRCSNPWSDLWRTVRLWHGPIGTNWAWECQISRTTDIVDVVIEVNANCDHAGARLALGMASWHIECSVYDRRHLAPL